MAFHFIARLMNLNAHRYSKADLPYILIVFTAIVYLAICHSLLLAIACLSFTLFYTISRVLRWFPLTRQFVGNRIQFWHIVCAMATICVLLGVLEAPSYAVFLSGMENFIVKIAQDSGSGIPDSAVTLIFNLIRGVFLLVVSAAGLFAYNQAQQGNDWRPIAGQVSMAFGIVIGLDVLTKLFVGGE